jgi:hypothetical protein
MEAFPTGTCELRLHGEGSTYRERTPAPRPDPTFRPVVSADGATLFYVSNLGAWLVAFDLETGAVARKVALGISGWSWLGISGDRRWLAVPSRNCVLIRDTGEDRWAARLTHPASVYAPQASVSRDGRWVAAVCQKNVGAAGSRGAFTHELTIWRVGPREEGASGTP